jgi:epoxyqueuosine reductase
MDKRGKIRSALLDFVEQSEENALSAHGNMKIYEEPLVGFAAASDPLFAEFQKPGIVGPNFLPPDAWLPGAKTVVSYFLPFTREIRASNREGRLPSEEWVSSRIDGEKFNNLLREYLVNFLKSFGEDAVSPCIDTRFRVVNRVSNWSERHAAFAAGLGTFGLHRALITEKGSAGRFGSVVTTLFLLPSERSYTTYFAYCPYLSEGKCGACMKRCPPGAISPDGKNHEICSRFIDKEVLPRFAPRYGCAKCNIAVPCESKIPGR